MNKWQINQILKGHTSNITCIKMNQDENILISGSVDRTIKFWQKQNNIWKSIQSIDCQSQILSISLSNKEDQLIVSVLDKQILVIQLQDKEWMIQQKILVEQQGFRLCFINEDQFLFQPANGCHLLIFYCDPKDQTFKKRQELQYQKKMSDIWGLFPINYIPQIGLILVKNGHYVRLIKKVKNDKFTVEQSINFGTNMIFGCISNDGRYITTWDNKFYEINIRKFQF